jgi:serine/threonine-protein kinase
VPGHRLDRYELLWPVADGGMASVWVARLSRKHGFEKIVAIKTILPKLAADDRFQKMFLDEGRIASRIDHVNVAQILDLGEENEVFYIVMEWIDGDSISRLQRTVAKKGATMPLPIVLRILADTCDGLHAAHELRGPEGALLGVVHRDVSPQNVLVTTGGVAKLIDFGIAKAKNRLAADTSAGFLKGKVHYMAPEQALGKPVDRRADVFGVGALLYQLIAGHPPYEGENELETLHKLGSGAPPAPFPASSGVPRAVSDVIVRALAHSPDERWSSAAELRAALERAMAMCGLVASTSDVAAFVNEHLADHIANRRRAIEAATQAASARGLPLSSGEIPIPTSSTEIMNVSGGYPAQMTPSGASPIPAPAASSRMVGGRVEVEVGSSGGGSLGLGSVAASVAAPAAPAASKNRALVVAVVALGVLAVVGVALIGTSLRAKAAAAHADGPPSPASSLGAAASGSATQPAAEPTAIASATPSPTPITTPTSTPPPTVATATASAKANAIAVATAPPKAAAVVLAPSPPKAAPAPAKPPPPAPTPKKKRIDDGF